MAPDSQFWAFKLFQVFIYGTNMATHTPKPHIYSYASRGHGWPVW